MLPGMVLDGLPGRPCLSRHCEDVSFMMYIGTGSIPRIGFVRKHWRNEGPMFAEPAVVPVVAVPQPDVELPMLLVGLL
jgi:hypothetical protein